jgi:hypothetical protein
MRIAVVVALVPSLAAADTVVATRSHWSGDVIVTESDVRGGDGTTTTVISLGGTVDGIGMTFSHVTAPTSGLALRDASNAIYGLQRTTRSGRPLHRPYRDINIVYDAAGTATIPGQLELAALDDAMAPWMLATTSCGGVRFHRTIESDVPTATDGVDTIHFRDDKWCRPATDSTPELCYPPDAAAVTRLSFVDDPSDPDDGTILEGDMDINAVGYALQVDGAVTNSTATPMDLLSVATHEMGHMLGLAHDCAIDGATWPSDASGAAVPSCDSADALHVAQTMYIQIQPGDLSKRTLEDGDIEAACAALADLPIASPVTGDCSAGGPPTGLVIAAAVPLAVRRRRRR